MNIKKYKYVIIVLIVIIILGFILIFLRGNEDDWIKNDKGVYIKHGNPGNTPEKVTKQQDAINCALALYSSKKESILEFNSECLGVCNEYSVDIVNVPRNTDDNLVENQCNEYKDGITKNFIELDKDGNIVRVKD
jgi:hypothetical protein